MCVITQRVMAVRSFFETRQKKKENDGMRTPCVGLGFTYSLMAILSECRDDTDDMLWDIYKEKD